MIYVQLFWSFFQIGLFSIGGGYASLPLIQKQIVEANHWLTMSEFTDVLTISQMTPGPIAINASSFVGMRIGGVPGAIIATAGCVAPSCIIVLTIAYVYVKYQNLWAIQGTLRGLRPAVVALIVSSALSIILLALFKNASTWFSVSLPQMDVVAVGIMLTGLVVLRRWKCNPIYVIAGAGVIGLLAYYVV